MNRERTVAFHTLGCKLNFAVTSTIARQLKGNGFQKVDFENAADVYVINTCSVTENADKECRMIVRRALHANPSAFIAVIGCYAQLKPQEIASIEGVDLVLGANEKFNIPEYLVSIRKKGLAEVHSCEIDSVHGFSASYSAGDRTRAFLKVQDGCDYTCSYCTIPLARGASRSASIADIVNQVAEIASRGIKEIVLTGVNIGDFGIQDNRSGVHSENFTGLIRRLDECEGIERFRISSIEPNLLKDEIIQFVAQSKKFVPHFHIPLQSGNDKILGLMRRRYRRDLYVERINRIRELIPDACIGADVITGFPGETDEDFLQTYEFLVLLDVNYLHVFTYSERDNTDAILLPSVVPVATRKERNKRLRILSEKKIQQFYASNLGKEKTVLFESAKHDQQMHGYTENYVKVSADFDPALINCSVDVELQEIKADGTVRCTLKESVLSN